MIGEREIKEWLKVGEKTKKVREKIYGIIEEGISYRELYYKILKEFKKEGLDLAFPINISKNYVAAHDTASIDDNRVLEKGDIVKIDIGGNKDGYITDTAITIEINSNRYEKLVNKTREILEKIEEILKPGIKVSEIGKIVEKEAYKANLKPIYNLSGHTIDRYTLHSSISIPNFDNKSKDVLINTVVAIEIFLTNGKGFVKEEGDSKIFSLIKKKTRNPLLKRYIEIVYKERKNLPFDLIYLYEKFKDKYKIVLDLLRKEGLIREYPPLVEINKGIVAQFEHTYIITDKEVIRIT